MKRILLNSARCLSCHTTLVSRHLGDYRNCSCGQLGINGGTERLERHYAGLPGTRDWTELSIYDEGPGREASDRGVEPAPEVRDGGGGEERGDVPGDGGRGRKPVRNARPVQPGRSAD